MTRSILTGGQVTPSGLSSSSLTKCTDEAKSCACGTPKSAGWKLGTGPMNHLSIELTARPDIKYSFTSSISNVIRGLRLSVFVFAITAFSGKVKGAMSNNVATSGIREMTHRTSAKR